MSKKEINFDEEISKIDERISKLKMRRQQLQQQKTERENEEIIALIKSNKVSVEKLKELISTFMVGKNEKVMEENNEVANV